jgi:hypothetical protein
MPTTTDTRTIYRRDIALDPKDGGKRIIANVLENKDGKLRLDPIGDRLRLFYQDGHLFRDTSEGRKDLGAYDICWQGTLPGHHSENLQAGLDKVARMLRTGQHCIKDYDDLPVQMERGSLRDLMAMIPVDAQRTDYQKALIKSLEDVLD